jgi:hypothetical protein
MSQSPILPRLARALRRARSGLRGGHLVAVSAVAVMAVVGLAGVRAVERSASSPVGDGGLRIEVVHPVEPDIVPGSVMDVGELVDGFEGVPPPPPQAEVLWSHDEGWDEEWTETEAAPWPAEPRLAGARPYEPPPEPGRVSPARVVQRWFGFDAPRRDFRAEREARRARLEALERRAWEARRQDMERHDRRGFDDRRDEGRWANREDAPRPYDEDYAAAEPVVGFSD